MVTRVLLIDGLNLVRRIFEARGAKGDAEFVDACRLSLQRCLHDLNPSHGVVVWDSAERTWRHLLDDQYKANRSATPAPLVETLPDLKAEFLKQGVRSLKIENYEADDVIATMSVTLTEAKVDAIVVSTDKMFYPLMARNVRIYHQFDRQWVDRDEVETKYQLKLSQLVDYWALSGDNSNNIKGVPGVGKKTATRLLQTHGSLADMLVLDEANKEAGKVLEYRAEAIRCRQLAALKLDVDLGVNLRDYRIH